MALKISIASSIGITLPDAYIKVANVAGSKELMQLCIQVYTNELAAKNKKSPVETTYKNFTPSVREGSENFIKQGYEFLKGLPEYLNATDC